MENPMEDRDYLRRMAALEQVAAGFKSIGSILKLYYSTLEQSGFTKKEAMKLTISYQEILVKTALDSLNEKADADIEELDDEEEDGDEYSSN